MKAGEYYERHHIVPRSMGGSDRKSNIVSLTAREHYLAHWLLYKIHRNASMAAAWYFMRTHSSGKRYVSSSFEYARKAHIRHLTGRKLSEEHKEKIRQAGIGRKCTESQKLAASMANKKREWSKESREKASKAKKGIYVRGKHGRARKVRLVENDMVFECMVDAADWLGVTKASVFNQIKKGGKSKGYTVVYAD